MTTNSLPNLTVNVPPILEVRDYATAYGYSVTARFDFSGVPPEHHRLLLQMVLRGGGHLEQPASKPKPKPRKTTWWHRLTS